MSGEEGSCAPGPSLSPPRLLLLSPGPPARARSEMEFPQRWPPQNLAGEGGGEQAQAGVGGNSPPPPPGPNSSESSDLPAAPAGCPQGLGGGQRRCVGERGGRGGGGVRGRGGEGDGGAQSPSRSDVLPLSAPLHPSPDPHLAAQLGRTYLHSVSIHTPPVSPGRLGSAEKILGNSECWWWWWDP